MYTEGISEANVILVTGDGYSYTDIECCGYDSDFEMFYIVTDSGKVMFPRESVSVFYVKPSEQAEVIQLHKLNGVT